LKWPASTQGPSKSPACHPQYNNPLQKVKRQFSLNNCEINAGEKMPLPKQYQFLTQEPGPKMLQEALKLYGTLEVPGDRDSPTIMAWANELGLKNVYSGDSVPWCGLFMLTIYTRAGKTLPDGLKNDNMLWALNWAKVGSHVDPKNASLGDILTFKRNGGGHVTMYVGEDASTFYCFGGNQGDAVSIERIAKNRLYEVRRPPYNSLPTNIRKIILNSSGPVSTNEA
jgi:uncharacterized protein (TIGR02594 family)